MSCDGLTLGKIIFGCTPRVVLPPQHSGIREKTFPTMGWMQFRHIKKVKQFFVGSQIPAKQRNLGFYSNSLKQSKIYGHTNRKWSFCNVCRCLRQKKIIFFAKKGEAICHRSEIIHEVLYMQRLLKQQRHENQLNQLNKLYPGFLLRQWPFFLYQTKIGYI